MANFFLNVSDSPYNASPSNSASANHSAFQGALDDAHQNGYEVLIPYGTYNIDEALIIGQGTTIRGINQEKTHLKFQKGGFYAANSAKATYDIKILNMTLSCTATSGNHKGIEIIGDNGVNTGRLELCNLLVKNFTGDGIRIFRPILTRLANIQSENNGGNGFLIEGDGTSTTLERCFSKENNAHGYHWYGVNYSSLINCASDQNNGNGYYMGSDDVITTNISLVGCGTEKNSGEQYYFRKVWGLSIVSCTSLPIGSGKNMLFLDGIRQGIVSGVYMNHKPPTSYYSIKISNASGTMWPENIVIISSKFGNSDILSSSQIEIINSTVPT